MKKFFTILKFALLIALLVAVGFGYHFFQIWQKNERPTVEEISWDREELVLGHAAVLNFTIRAPWHRELDSTRPTSHPAFLVPVSRLGAIKKGSLDFSGYRTWEVTVPFVSTETKTLEGMTASFPIKKTERNSPNSVNFALPKLAVIEPESIPEDPENPGTFLTEDKPAPAPLTNIEIPESKSFWPWVIGGLFVLALIVWILRRTGIIKTTPPWERALSRLDSLSPDAKPEVFFSKLTDILKQYTSERYGVRARAKTSSEFIGILRNLPQIPNKFLTELPSFAKLADAVKFAERKPLPGDSNEALDLVRSFVKATTPDESEGKSKSSGSTPPPIPGSPSDKTISSNA